MDARETWWTPVFLRLRIIFDGKRVPVFFAVWDWVPIKTTLLRDLDELVPVRYVTFSSPEELKQSLLDFLGAVTGISETDSAAFAVLSSSEADELTALAGRI